MLAVEFAIEVWIVVGVRVMVGVEVMEVGLALFLGTGLMAEELRVRSLLLALRKSPFFLLVS